MRSRNRSENGFTLIELMMSAALIGVMAAVAIPNYLTFQARSRQAEAYTNLASLARAYQSYYADQGIYPDMLSRTVPPEPSLPPTATLGTTKLTWDSTSQAFFDIVGWGIEGNVFYTYDVTSPEGGSCTCTAGCFTATAHGDVDGDGGWSTLMFAVPQVDANGNNLGECSSAIDNLFAPIYNEVTWRTDRDRF
jgi:type IV pilus assembly protein PilA